MLVIPGSYTLPQGDLPLNHARILHARNWLTGGTITASSTDADYFEDAPDYSMTYEEWKPGSLPASWERDYGTPQTVDCVGIADHTLGSDGASVAVEYWNGSAWVTLASFAPTDDAPIFVMLPRTVAQVWRIVITGSTAPIVGVVKFGLALQMPRRLAPGHTPIEFGRQIKMRSTYAETGNFLGRTKINGMLATKFEWHHLTWAWTHANWPVLQRAVESEPFFIAWHPGRSQMVGYCQCDDIPPASEMGVRDMFQAEIAVRGLAHD